MEKFIRYLGNFFIVLSVVALLVIYYPVIQLYLSPPKIKTQLPKAGYFLTIPKISAQAPIIENVDPWNPPEYLAALKQGVASAKGFSHSPGSGFIYLFAHSTGPPWEITRYNTIFLRLPELQINDQITLTKDGHDFAYQVRAKKEVWPTDTDFLQNTTKNELVIQTCIPIGTSLKRLLVFADPAV